MLRWHVEQGLVAIPKSANPQRMKENLGIFDFALDTDDMTAIATLDGGARDRSQSRTSKATESRRSKEVHSSADWKINTKHD